jgi:hypothetical protein
MRPRRLVPAVEIERAAEGQPGLEGPGRGGDDPLEHTDSSRHIAGLDELLRAFEARRGLLSCGEDRRSENKQSCGDAQSISLPVILSGRRIQQPFGTGARGSHSSQPRRVPSLPRL